MSTYNINTSVNLPYRTDIDGLRALAVLSVVCFHFFPQWFPGGFVGVDIFFVISGFLISSIIIRGLERDSFTFIRFYGKRVRRIFPALLVVLSISYIIGISILLPDENFQLGKHIFAGSTFISNFILWNESGYFDNAASTKPLLHLWSLGIEEQFYIVWPPLLWLLWKKKLNTTIIIGLIAITSFLLNIIIVQHDTVSAFYLPQTRFWELLIGSFLANTISSRFKYKYCTNSLGNVCVSHLLNNINSLFGLALIVLGVVLATPDQPYPSWLALLPTIGTALIIFSGVHTWLSNVILSSSILVWFGLISFPLYLWHWSLLSFVRLSLGQLPTPEIRIVIIFVSILLAWLTYRFIENPIRTGNHNKLKVTLLLSMMIMTGYIGYHNSNNISGFNTVLLSEVDKYHITDDVKKNSHENKFGKSGLEIYEEAFLKNPNYVEEMRELRRHVVRVPYCFLSKPNQSFEEFMSGIEVCLNIQNDRPNVLIIGDSHAADIYVALVNTHPTINFLQATGGRCTPIRTKHIELSDVSDRCTKLISYAINFAKKNKIDAVILAARWPNDFEGILNEINELRAENNKIILIGPPLEYTEDVYKIIARRDKTLSLDDYSKKFINLEKLSLNLRMHDFASKNQVYYIDRIKLYCDEKNICPLISSSGNLYILDYGHLLFHGSIYLGQQLLFNQSLTKFLERLDTIIMKGQ